MQRRLTAILSADVAGYSGLMEVDEAGTLERLKVNRSRDLRSCVAAQGGRVVKLMGDGALVEFGSVVAAVNCALAIQEATARAEAEHAGPKGIRYRIGINLGEVIVDGDDIYGVGVNVAARLQALAPVGGIAVSLTVRDQVAGKAVVRVRGHGRAHGEEPGAPGACLRRASGRGAQAEDRKAERTAARFRSACCRSPT